jgi:hypothetical protein
MHWLSAPAGEATAAFVQRVLDLLSRIRRELRPLNQRRLNGCASGPLRQRGCEHALTP